MTSRVAEKLISSARHRLGRFLAWWKSGLAAGLPEPVRALLAPTDRALVMRTDAAGATLDLSGGQGARQLAAFCLEDPFPPVAARLLRQPKTHLDMVLSAERVLRRTITWPQNVEPRLRNALAYQLDRLTPRSAETAYFDYRIRSRDTREGKIEVEIAVVSREEVDPWLERLRQAGVLGMLRSIRAASEDGLDFLPAQIRQASRNGLHWRWPAYGLICAVLTATALVLPIYGKHQRLALLDREIAAARGRALNVTEMRRQTDRLVEAIAAVVDARRHAVPVLADLEELTQRVPDSAYVQRLDYDGDTITIAGEADKSVDLVEVIAASPLFGSVGFAAPVSMNRMSGKERFRFEIAVAEAAR